jgi:hypothetical protein
MVTGKITRISEGLDLILILREDRVAFPLDSFWSVNLTCPLSQTVSVVVAFSPNASCRRRPSPFTFLLLNLVLCMEHGLVVFPFA